jgi:hypothetical protein
MVGKSPIIDFMLRFFIGWLGLLTLFALAWRLRVLPPLSTVRNYPQLKILSRAERIRAIRRAQQQASGGWRMLLPFVVLAGGMSFGGSLGVAVDSVTGILLISMAAIIVPASCAWRLAGNIEARYLSPYIALGAQDHPKRLYIRHLCTWLGFALGMIGLMWLYDRMN